MDEKYYMCGIVNIKLRKKLKYLAIIDHGEEYENIAFKNKEELIKHFKETNDFASAIFEVNDITKEIKKVIKL